MLAFKYIIAGLIIIITAILVAYYLKLEYTYENGYKKGKLDMALEITDKINLNVDNKTYNPREYKHFMFLKEINFYIYEKDGCRTIVRDKE